MRNTRLVVDENVPKEVVDFLKTLSFREVYWIAEHKRGLSDPEVWRLAIIRSALLITGDLGFLKQLTQLEILQGPAVLEYATRGFSKSELQDPRVMGGLLSWYFQNGHHRNKEHVSLFVQGKETSRRKLWQYEDARRRRLP
jgi:predicted nuclease of predicted toxin-antitoxin system